MNIEAGKQYEIYVRFIDFPIGIPNNIDSHLVFRGEDLLHAIATCGVYHPLDRTSAGFLYKKYLIECQFKVCNGELFLSDEYKSFDQSEKNCLSYFRGMIFGRLIADLRFDLTYFVHLSNFKKYNKIHYVSDKRPDIIGWNRRFITKYYVWECKGNRAALSEGKDQARAVSVINHWDVERQIASAVYPTERKEKIFARVKDPKPQDGKIEIDMNEALEIYYFPIVQLIRSSQEIYKDNGVQYGKMNFSNGEHIFGLPTSIYNYFLNNEQNNSDNITLERIIREYSDVQFGKVENMFDDFVYIK